MKCLKNYMIWVKNLYKNKLLLNYVLEPKCVNRIINPLKVELKLTIELKIQKILMMNYSWMMNRIILMKNFILNMIKIEKHILNKHKTLNE